MIPVVTTARVAGCETLGAYRVLTLTCREIAQGARPGQFVMLEADTVLRRPFSVYLADKTKGTITIAFDAIGHGTAWLSARAHDDELSVVGPLGHGFEVPTPDGGADLLVGGGYGSAALAFLADELKQRGRDVHAILGARSADRIFNDATLERDCTTITITTDDGSHGTQGIVTDVMPEIVARHGISKTYACGPMRMLEAVARASTVPTQLAVEEFMACGIGVCWTCVLPIRVNGDVKHQRSCTEGPVFEAASVAWA